MAANVKLLETKSVDSYCNMLTLKRLAHEIIINVSCLEHAIKILTTMDGDHGGVKDTFTAR